MRWAGPSVLLFLTVGCAAEKMAYDLEVTKATLHMRKLPLRGRAFTSSFSDSESTKVTKTAKPPFRSRPPVTITKTRATAWSFTTDVGIDHEVALEDGDFVWTLRNDTSQPLTITWREPYRPRLDLGEGQGLALPDFQRLYFSTDPGEEFCGDGWGSTTSLRGPDEVLPSSSASHRLWVPFRKDRYCANTKRNRTFLPEVVRSFERGVLEAAHGRRITLWLPARTPTVASLLEVELELRDTRSVGRTSEHVPKPYLRAAPWRLGGVINLGGGRRRSPDGFYLFSGLGVRLKRILAVNDRFILDAGLEIMGEAGGEDHLALWTGLRLAPGVGSFPFRGSQRGFGLMLPMTLSYGLVQSPCVFEPGSLCSGPETTADNLRFRFGLALEFLTMGGAVSFEFFQLGLPIGEFEKRTDWQLELLGFSLDASL